jgi:hypothetical protein
MSNQTIAISAGLIVLNAGALWTLFFGGAAWLEGTGLFAWQIRRQWRADAPAMSAGVFKVCAGLFIVLEAAVGVIAFLGS